MHVVLGRQPDGLADRQHQRLGELPVGLARCRIGIEGRDAAADGGRGVGHYPDDRHPGPEGLLEDGERLAGGDREDESGRHQPDMKLVEHRRHDLRLDREHENARSEAFG
jgi:hypothetical protein